VPARQQFRLKLHEMVRCFVGHFPSVLFIDAIMNAAIGEEVMVFEIELIRRHSETQTAQIVADSRAIDRHRPGASSSGRRIDLDPEFRRRCGRVWNARATALLSAFKRRLADNLMENSSGIESKGYLY
jgi:hypothetical protein